MDFDAFTRHVAEEKMLMYNNNQLTQSIFLEHQWNKEVAVYSWGDRHKEYKGKVYPSLKKLYLDMGDVTEYNFATTHLLGWSHWQRLNRSEYLADKFREWREELEVKVRAGAIENIMTIADSDSGGFQAAKWLADKGWDKRGAGRPSKQEVEKETRVQAKIAGEFTSDVKRMNDYRTK